MIYLHHSSAAVPVWFCVQFENGNVSIFNKFLLVSPSRMTGSIPLSEYGSSTFSIIYRHGLD